MNDYDDMTTVAVTIKIMGVSTSLMAALPGWVRARPREERSEEVIENWMMNDDYFRMQSTTRQIDNLILRPYFTFADIFSNPRWPPLHHF